jgi:hypothetical protein
VYLLLTIVVPIFEFFFAIRRWLLSRSGKVYRTHLTKVHPWVRRGLGAGAIFGGCFENTFSPIFGTLPGVLEGTLIGGFGGLIVASSIRLQQRRGLLDPALIERRAKTVSFGLVALGLLFGYWYLGRNFDAPVSRYVSKGEYVRMFYSDVVWPTVVLVVYLLLAGPPSHVHPIVGETSKRRRVAIQILIVVAALSSIYIGVHYNFPHPD